MMSDCIKKTDVEQRNTYRYQILEFLKANSETQNVLTSKECPDLERSKKRRLFGREPPNRLALQSIIR
jgi:hypothetical protein